MKYLTFFVLGLTFIFLVSCSGDRSENNYNLIDQPLTIDSLAILDESSRVLGQPAAFTFINENDFAVATKQGEIVVYNLKGEKTLSFSGVGTGPLEYVDPGFIEFHDNKLFIWCKQLLKLVAYDLDGNALEEYTNFTNAIRGFEIVDNKVFFYRSGAASSPILEVYDLASQELITQVGVNSEESALLTMLPCAGGLNVVDDQVFFITPGELKIRHLNVKSIETVEEDIIIDDDFQVEQLSISKYQQIAGDIGLRIDFVNKNSSIGGLHIVDGMFVIKTRVGENQYENRWDASSFNRSNRFEKYLILDKSLNLVRSYKGPIFSSNDCLVESNGKALFTISAVESSQQDSFVYQLNRIGLGK